MRLYHFAWMCSWVQDILELIESISGREEQGKHFAFGEGAVHAV